VFLWSGALSRTSPSVAITVRWLVTSPSLPVVWVQQLRRLGLIEHAPVLLQAILMRKATCACLDACKLGVHERQQLLGSGEAEIKWRLVVLQQIRKEGEGVFAASAKGVDDGPPLLSALVGCPLLATAALLVGFSWLQERQSPRDYTPSLIS